MCEYCCSVDKKYNPNYILYKSFYILDDHSGEAIDSENNNNPVMYLRQYPRTNEWSIVTEFADDIGTAIELSVEYCPRCGRKLCD